MDVNGALDDEQLHVGRHLSPIDEMLTTGHLPTSMKCNSIVLGVGGRQKHRRRLTVLCIGL